MGRFAQPEATVTVVMITAVTADSHTEWEEETRGSQGRSAGKPQSPQKTGSTSICTFIPDRTGRACGKGVPGFGQPLPCLRGTPGTLIELAQPSSPLSVQQVDPWHLHGTPRWRFPRGASASSQRASCSQVRRKQTPGAEGRKWALAQEGRVPLGRREGCQGR